ncbi:MAG: excinuclease ABC subunit UvrA [Bacteroidetes bacterium]|nr:excinuclease ABC subunit UvrA [Bacteroidota bacterium]
MDDRTIIVRGARVHNLKNIDVDIPRGTLTVLTGLSGSGKSSLAFDTIYAEGQRRYVESLSAYARQFLDMMERPDCDRIDGLSPAISIEQKTVTANPRSTVGTVTEIYDFLRLLFARVGTQYCIQCGIKVHRQSVDQIIDAILTYPKGSRLHILAPVVRSRKGHYKELFEKILNDGFLRVRIDGVFREIEKGMKLDRYKLHTIEIVIDRIVMKSEQRSRIAGSVETALQYGDGVLIVHDGKSDQLFSQHYACHECGTSYEELTPLSFSFNTPVGYCPECEGLGEQKQFDLDRIIPDWTLSIRDGAIAPFGKPRDIWIFRQLEGLAKEYSFTFDTPLRELTENARKTLLYGTGEKTIPIPYNSSHGEQYYYHRFNGVFGILETMYQNTTSSDVRQHIEAFMVAKPCSVCNGSRLKPSSLAVKLEDEATNAMYSITDIVHRPLNEALVLFKTLTLSERKATIAHPILKEITSRLEFLLNVGLYYLTLNRPAYTLSGGESQRIRLATQIGSQLVGVLYILDEPSIGLHQRDNIKLIQSLKALRDLGNTVIVVEHDREMMMEADYLIDLGPGAGEHGGSVVVEGNPKVLLSNRRKNGQTTSLTLQYLRGERVIPVPPRRRRGNGKKLTLHGATGNNLKNITVDFPLGVFICVTGVSGSGKSTLINETLYPILAHHCYNSLLVPLPYRSIEGLEYVKKVVDVDQTPIGRTPRSNPATYTGLFTDIRTLFAQLPESQLRGYKQGRFSFNVHGGRCEGCEGAGLKRIEMSFLPDVYVPCDVCGGKRYNRETLEVHFKGKSIADILDMTVEEALTLFSDHPRINHYLKTLFDVGLGYIRLGQQATTLSGGEAQRVKLATELVKGSGGKTIYILDEPTTGLHFEDVRMLLDLLNKLVEKGNTVIVIEHNLDVIKSADWIIDLGPEGGNDGGYIVATGTPEMVAENPASYTGHFLKQYLSP